ncbi:DNA-binding NarL/FixJ family response regulator [Parabacteroides sp. PFB2-10]|uniref:response regulator transcription factor n=1 Tax=Parabacteroides sp. PFB2-10 TaxID=1742405 RepID=UPI002475845F|nr:response regulator transcription factor [Parabacteroides sp. PFB2-10]MDH6311423.1 DNA-binding NarL/FixJ family response regulator [Parabacteroides sp. PFB2-10]
MGTTLTIAIAEYSEIIRQGLEQILKRLPDFKIQCVIIAAHEQLHDTLSTWKPDLLVINPAFPGSFPLEQLRETTGCAQMKCAALIYAATDAHLLRAYDEQIHIYDTPDEIAHKLERMHLKETLPVDQEDEQQTLSTREKEIVVCVVKGMTNREIAEQLFLSTHTVITHRRNIARKLQIHSPSGLTIYAIVNKLVELSDIQ